METCPTYHAPLNTYEGTWNHKLFRESIRLFENKEHRASFRTLLDAINQEQARACQTSPDRWVLPHGSLVVEIAITDQETVEVHAPFLKLPSDRRAPILRQIWEINTSSLTLGLVKLEGDELSFHYATPLTLADPSKVYGILHEICVTGDRQDDLFVNDFGAAPLRDKEVIPLPAEQVERSWEVFQALLDEAASYDAYFSQKRQNGFCYDVLGLALMRIDSVIAPQGYLRAKLNSSTSCLWDRNRPMEEVLGQLRKELQFYQAVERPAFEQDLYRSNFFVGDRRSAEIQTCQKTIAQRYGWARQDKAQRNQRGVVLSYLFACYQLLYSFYLPGSMYDEIHSTLSACSGQPWEAAEEAAWASFQKIVDPAFA